MSTRIEQLSVQTQDILIREAEELGRQSGFIKCERKFNGESLAQMLVYGWQANPPVSLEELSQSAQAN